MRLWLVALSSVLSLACAKTRKAPAPDTAAAPVAAAGAAEPAPSPADAAPPDGSAAASDDAPPSPADGAPVTDTTRPADAAEFKVLLEQFADLRVLRFRVPGWDALPPRTRALVYHFTQAALAGRDITWDQRHPQGLRVRRTLEAIDATYKGDRTTPEYAAFETYLKRVWFSNGIYHHYSDKKLDPGFSKEAFAALVAGSDPAAFPLAKDETPSALADRLTPLLFDPAVDPLAVSLDDKGDLVADSANNYYARGLTQKEVEAFYADKKKAAGERPPMFGLNSKLIKNADGAIEERVWKIGGMYGPALEKAVSHLVAALALSESDAQKAWIEALIRYYKSGDLADFDAFNVAWVKDTDSTVDLIHGFIESYADPLDMRGMYESIVQVRDPEASRRIATISANAPWFEERMPYLPEHRKPDVKGISARVIDTVLGTGDAGPASPIGVNLPNSDWIRRDHGSKSVTLGNLMSAYEMADKASGKLAEFAADEAMQTRLEKYLGLADKLEVDMHEVIGHASGQLEPGVQPMTDTLKNYASALEEARADLVALYFLPDPKLVELGLVTAEDGPEVARAAYDFFIHNGMLIQLARIPLGEDIQQAHMRNRQLIAKWVIEKGGPAVVERIEKAPAKTAFLIRDYARLRELFGELLREIQRIKSQGDFEAGKALVEGYGVKPEPALHAEVKARWDKLGVAPFAGFVNPRVVPIEEGGAVVDARLEYVDDFATQMREYARQYSTLPTEN